MDKDLKNKLEQLLDKMFEKLSNSINEAKGRMEDAIQEPCEIKITNDGKGTAIAIEGCRLGILLTLAGAENRLLEQLGCSETEFEMYKKVVGSMDKEDLENE